MGDLAITAGRWWGWQEIPLRHAGWGASPVFVTDVAPLGTGKGMLRLGFVQAMHPRAAVRRSVTLRVLRRTPTHVAGCLADLDGERRTALLCPADFGWISACCPLLWRCRPPAVPTLMIDGVPVPGPDAAAYLAATLGRNEAEVLAGAAAARFGVRPPPPPAARTASLALGVTYPPFESWLIARGFVPQEMEDKWFIHMEDGDAGRLLFRRSWTGNLIYEVGTEWRGDSLHLVQARVNRDPAQYGQTDDAYDRRLLLFLIDAVLLGGRAQFPAPPGLDAEQGAIRAWSVAGKALL